MVCLQYTCPYIIMYEYVHVFFTGKNNLSEEEQEILLHLLRDIACFASNQKQYQEKLDCLLASGLYKNHPRVQRYLTTKWLGCTTVSFM